MLLNQSFRGMNELWRYLVGILIVFCFYFLGQLPLYGFVFWKFSSDSSLGEEALAQFESNLDFEMLGLNKNIGFLLLILMFGFAMFGLYLVIRYVHKKELLSYITTKANVDYKKILFGFGLWMIISVLLEAVSYLLSPETYSFRWIPESFIPLLLISLVFLPVQTSFEELFFRGYIMQGIAFFAQNKWLPILLSSIFFGFVHGTNPEVAKYGFWTMQMYYIVAGLFLALITVLDDGLELALGVHAATNIFGATLFTYEGSVLQTDSLFISNEVKPWLMILGFIIGASIFIFVCFKKYAWPSFNTLLDKVSADQTEITGFGQSL
jgi:uncharacterized protein